MHYECDFREQYEKELQELKEVESRKKTPEQEEFDLKQMRWIIEMANMEKSQYEKVLNEEKLDLIHTGYRYLCRVAEIQGGHVVMDMNEDAMIAHISYTAKTVCQSCVGDDCTAKVLGLLMIKFNSVTIWAEGGEFTIKVDADYYDEKMVKDLRDELERRKIEHRKWIRENQRKEWYGFIYNGTKFLSRPMTEEAQKKHPPRFLCKAEIKVGEHYVAEISPEITEYANRHQFKITIDIQEAEKLLGDIPDPIQTEAEHIVGAKGVIEPVPFPPAFPCAIKLDGQTEYEYVELRTEEILDDGVIVISNREQQNTHMRIRMNVNFASKTVSFKMTTVEATNRELLQYVRFMKKAMDGAKLTIYVLSLGKEMVQGDLGNCDYKSGFHENAGTYYNRDTMHATLGYDEYYSAKRFFDDEKLAEIDANLIKNDDYWELMITKEPFLDFIITYSAHVPYHAKDELTQYAFEKYPEYNIVGGDEELNSLYAKARLTDDMFAELLERLEESNLLENTVIIAYTDHYCYGLTNKDLMSELSEKNGSRIVEKTPAFIWYKGCRAETVDKICQSIDWVPTIANMFGKDVTPYVMGNDIFDQDYAGYAIFPDGTWLTDNAYAVNGIGQLGSDLSNAQIEGMNRFVGLFYEANEAIMQSDYYSKLGLE